MTAFCRWQTPLKNGRHVCQSTQLGNGRTQVTGDFCRRVCPMPNHVHAASASLRVKFACLHQPPPAGARVMERLPARVPLPVFQCDLHGQVDWDKHCPPCLDYQPATEEAPYEIVPGLFDPVPRVRLSDCHQEFANLEPVRLQHAEGLRRLLLAEIPPPDRAAGDGIVICGGGRYWPMVARACHMARRVTKIPIQVWTRGRLEPVNVADLCDLPDITICDATAIAGLRQLGGWEIKAVALLHCGWERVLLLDADAYLVADPSPWLNLATRDRPIAYWHDFPNHWTSIDWPAFGLSDERYMPPIQGGQIAFNRAAAWRQLVLSQWLNQHSDYFYYHGYGDQDMWRVAWSATRAPYHDLGMAGYAYPAFVCCLGGAPIVVHRVHEKTWDFQLIPRPAGLPCEVEWRAISDLLRSKSMNAAEVFRQVYARGDWSPNGTSGRGSGEIEGAPYIAWINAAIAREGWQRIVDLGAGDGYILSNLAGQDLVGVDCVRVSRPDLAGRHGFIHWETLDLDVDRSRLPAGDVALVKDVFHHWPNALVVNWLQWARASRKWKALVITNDTWQNPTPDCELGGYRGLDPTLPPLSTIPGLERVHDYLHKSICLLRC